MKLDEDPDLIPVLIVDDRPENLLSLEELLRNHGYELVKALSGNEALRLMLKQDFALVLLDVQMPEMDGFETAELMRMNPKTSHIPIIFVTAGMNDLHFKFKGYDAGAVDYLTKPIEPLFLQSKVRIFAELYRQRHEIELQNNHLEELVEQRTSELLHSAAELKASNDELKYINKELKATEELLRDQVTEFVETHDQLLSTEEMLRVQIEEYQNTQKQLNESNISLQTLFDVSPLAIVVSSFEGGIIRKINNTFSEDFGYQGDHVIGRTGVEIGLWVNNDERDIFLRLTHEQQSVSGFAAEIRTCLGKNRNVLLYFNLMDFRGEKCRLIVFMDVTDQKRLEDQIRQTQKMDVIAQLADGIAHDFNNMLTVVLGSSELMERHIMDNPSALKHLGTIQQAASRSADMTAKLLEFSRKGQNKAVIVCINSTVAEVISLLERTIDKKITLESRLIAESSCVIGDQSQLQNALLNLGVNARDAMPDGGVIKFTTTNIELDAEFCASCSFSITPGPYIEISITDTGMGMTKEIIPRVFDPFFTTKEIGKRTGLGLASVYGAITDNHGCISLFSEPGIGTAFKLYLPLSDKHNTEVPCDNGLYHGSGGILLVDDEELIRNIGKEILEDLGYRVYLAEDGISGLEVYRQEKKNISVVILDMLMPRMGGREALVRLKEMYPDIRVVVSSGFHKEGTITELEKLGAVGFLPKPYLQRELGKVVAEAINATNEAGFMAS